jgi:hypothetical protein
MCGEGTPGLGRFLRHERIKYKIGKLLIDTLSGHRQVAGVLRILAPLRPSGEAGQRANIISGPYEDKRYQ